MLFQYSETQSAIGTSNITHILCEDGLKTLNANDSILTPNNFYEIFGPASEYEPEPERGYTEPEWYFKGPGKSVLGIGWRYGSIRLRGKNIHNQFLPPSEICKTFLTELVEHFNNFMLIKE